jgi:hypothetical protein
VLGAIILMPQVRSYEVTLRVTGPVKITHTITFNANKELRIGEVFDSAIEINPDTEGFHIIATVFTAHQEQANKIALLFVGRMLDMLSILVDLPLFVSLISDWKYTKESNQKAILDKTDFQKAFELSRIQSDKRSTFLRGLSWRRKALYTEDPYDRFFAYWLSIEVIANKFNPNRENCKDAKTGNYKGSICNIWECFKHLWGENRDWKVINGQEKWIDENALIRNKIGHGTFAVDVKSVDEIIQRLSLLKEVSYNFLVDWGNKELNCNLNH